MATVSLRVAHQKGCANESKTALASLEGCKCRPSYYTFHRDKSGRPVKGKRVKARRVAERQASILQGDLDSGKLLRRQHNIDFNTWADTWLKQHTAKESTRKLYGYSLDVAKQAFGHLSIREIESSDIGLYFDLLRKAGEDRKRPITPTTLNRHYRTLHTCLAAAIPEYADTNPATQLHRSLRPRAESDRWDYFTDDELARLWQSFQARKDNEGLYLSKVAVTTGLRLGELAALRRRDVDLANNRIEIGHAYRSGVGLTTPKSGKRRTVHLSADATAVLRDWFELRLADGSFTADALLFRNSQGEYINRRWVTEGHLYPAMRHAKPPDGKRLKKGEWGIPRIGERGNPRVFHSFRHTYARIVLENGASRFWLQTQLGHSSGTMTERYSAWSKQAERDQAERIVAGAFPV